MTPLHLIDLGEPVDPETLKLILKGSWQTELVRGIMQTIRDHGFAAINSSKEGVKERNDAWIHAQLGAHDACESIVQTFHEIVMSKEPDPEA